MEWLFFEIPRGSYKSGNSPLSELRSYYQIVLNYSRYLLIKIPARIPMELKVSGHCAMKIFIYMWNVVHLHTFLFGWIRVKRRFYKNQNVFEIICEHIKNWNLANHLIVFKSPVIILNFFYILKTKIYYLIIYFYLKGAPCYFTFIKRPI